MNSENLVIEEMAPNFLMHVSRHIPKSAKDRFPMFQDLALSSGKYVDELQYLNASQMTMVREELKLLSDVINRKLYLPNVDTEKMRQNWITEDYSLDDINKDIESLDVFFEKAIELNLVTRVIL